MQLAQMRGQVQSQAGTPKAPCKGTIQLGKGRHGKGDVRLLWQILLVDPVS